MMEQTDRAISRPEQDLLGRELFVETLAKALVQDLPATTAQPRVVRSKGNIVGLTGSWGSGKSSILNLLAEYLGTRSRVIVVKFNPWLFKSHFDLLDGFFNELTSQIAKDTRDEIKALITLADEYRDALEVGGSALNLVAPGLGTGWKILIRLLPKKRQPSAHDSRLKLEQKLAKLDLAIVVLIDELDRVEDEEVRSVARLIKAVGDIPGISYLVAYDPKRVCDALGRGEGVGRTISGEAYLEKIIQLVVPIRPLLDYEVKNLLAEALKRHGFKDLDRQDSKLLDILIGHLQTPRDVKRLVSNFAAIEPMVHGEVNALDVLGYCYLLVKAHSIREFVAANIDSVVDDPSEQFQLERVLKRVQKEDITVEKTFGAIASGHEKLLKKLFPIFSDKPEVQEFDRDRISKRRNLLRLLYLGNPPHDISRQEVEQFWQGDAAAIEQKIRDIIAQGRLTLFVDRLQDVFRELPEDRDVIVWPSIAKALMRDHDWMESPEPHRSVVDDLEAMIRTMDDGAGKKRARAIVDSLVKSGDLMIAPAIWRSHVFRYGMARFSSGSSREIPIIYSKEEFEKILKTEVPRLQYAIQSGEYLKRVIDADALFLLSNLQEFNDARRSDLTSQLNSTDAVTTFAGLILPPGYMIEKSGLDQIVDSVELLQNIEALTTNGAFDAVSDPLLFSVRRLREVLRGGDPHDVD